MPWTSRQSPPDSLPGSRRSPLPGRGQTRSAADILSHGIPDLPSRRVVVGFNWTAVEGPDGLGLAATPSRADGARSTADTGTYGGRSLARLAAMIRSDNPLERAIAVAAGNAHWNRAADHPHDTPGREADGLSDASAEGRVVVVGRFPNLAEKLPGAVVLERNPGPDDLPAEAADQVVPGCARLIVTASTLVNGTFDGLLALASPETRVSLVGPGTPLAPGLFGIGVHRLAGFVASDPEACLKAVMEGAVARTLKRYGREVTISAG